MRNLKRRLVPPLLAVVATSALSCSTQRETPSGFAARNRSIDEAAIRGLLAANEAAANKHDAAGVAATYAPEGDIVAFAGGPITGRDAIRRHEEAFFAGAPQVQFAPSIRSLRFVTDDVAIVEADSVHRFPDRQTRERATLVVVRRDGPWSISAVRVLPAQQAVDTPQDTNASDARQITERLAAYDRANNAGDLDGLMTFFAEDAVSMAPDQPSVVGTAAMGKVVGGWLAGQCTVQHQPGETESFGEIVIHRGTATGTCSADASSFNNKYLHVYRRQPDGSLKYWRGAFNSNAPAR